MNDETIQLNVEGGETINVVIDQAAGKRCGRVVLVPPFGMSGERMFAAAYILTMNGFDVLRCDPRDQPGESSGSTETFRLSRLTKDISAVLTLAPDGILAAMSLSGRGALRALRNSRDMRGAVLVTPVVNVRRTLFEVLGDDWFERIAYDNTPRVRVLGHFVSTDFIHDCQKHNFINTEDSVADVLAGHAEVTLIAGEDDPWVSLDDVRALEARTNDKHKRTRVITVGSASHQLYRNPVLAMTFMQIMTSECLRLAGVAGDTAVFPLFSEIVAAIEHFRTSPNVNGASTAHGLTHTRAEVSSYGA